MAKTTAWRIAILGIVFAAILWPAIEVMVEAQRAFEIVGNMLRRAPTLP